MSCLLIVNTIAVHLPGLFLYVVGDHLIHVTCGNKPVKGSPFLVRSYDPLLVFVKDLPNTAQLNDDITFTGEFMWDMFAAVSVQFVTRVQILSNCDCVE